MTKPRIERALGYVRVSTQRRIVGAVSLDDQENRLGIDDSQPDTEVIKIYRYDGFFGATDNRPGLQGLIERAARFGSCVTEIGVFSFSRLFRDHGAFEQCHRKLKRAGVRVVAITQEISSNAESDFVRNARRSQ